MRSACILFPAFVQIAVAGVLLVETGTDFRTGAAIKRELKLDAWRVSIEIQDADSHQTIVYQISPEQVWMIDHKQKFYREFDRETLKMLREHVRAVRESSVEQGQGAPDSGPRFTKAWAGETVGDWTCDKYEGRVSSVKVLDVCAADWSQFEVRPSDFDSLREAATAMRALQLWPEDALLPPRPPGEKGEHAFLGIPVQRLRQQNERTVELLELREIGVRDFTDADFAPPADYTSRPILLMPAAESSDDRGARERPGKNQ